MGISCPYPYLLYHHPSKRLLKGIRTEADYADFRDMLARYFADKAQKQIDALWEDGTINEQTIEAWGNERMRTPYRYAVHRS